MIIDGKKIAKDLRQNLKNEIQNLKNNVKPYLVVILIGNNTASKIYVKNKEKSASEVGIKSKVIELEANISEKDLIKKIEYLNLNINVHGILVQLPLPKHIDERKIISKINPIKDVDGFHPVNVGNLSSGNDAMIPCTPLGCYLLLKNTIQNLSGKNVVIIGRSNINGKPMAQLLLKENCTVTVTHSKTKNIEKICKHADIIVVAVGKPKMINKNWVNKNSVVIDVGINRIEENGSKKIVGDADFENIKNEVFAITPVPGGVGPMTIACLLKNTLKAFKNQVK
tara:strand:+ start:267 stop:1115 length:849 start_codon:yes stop_codon:yes gene_type:complete